MKKIYLFALVTALVMFQACSGKQYFEPTQTYGASGNSYGGTIVDLSRDGATLENGHYIGKSGISSLNLGEGYRFLSENSQYVLASNTKGTLIIIDKKSKKVIHTVSLSKPVVAASIKNNIIAYILNSNTFGLYNISSKKKIIESPSEVIYAIDTRTANPIFVDNLAVMPMLDGKLVIVDMYNPENAKVIYLSSYDAFNNVIYLSRIGDTLVAATPKKIITLGNNGEQGYHANLSEMAISNHAIYIFTKEGKIVRLNRELEVLSEKKFKFAHFSVATVLHEKVYALDQQGSLIVLSKDLSQFKIYDLGEVKTPAYITGSKLYKDGKIINLSKLGYE